jgi:hypothetical protein
MIDLNVPQEAVVRDLLDHMSNPAIEQDSVYVDKVLHFLALVLSPPIPFTNKGVEQ